MTCLENVGVFTEENREGSKPVAATRRLGVVACSENNLECPQGRRGCIRSPPEGPRRKRRDNPRQQDTCISLSKDAYPERAISVRRPLTFIEELRLNRHVSLCSAYTARDTQRASECGVLEVKESNAEHSRDLSPMFDRPTASTVHPTATARLSEQWYRAYPLSHTGSIEGPAIAILAHSDDEALREAHARLGDQRVEVWTGTRLVGGPA